MEEYPVEPKLEPKLESLSNSVGYSSDSSEDEQDQPRIVLDGDEQEAFVRPKRHLLAFLYLTIALIMLYLVQNFVKHYLGLNENRNVQEWQFFLFFLFSMLFFFKF